MPDPQSPNEWMVLARRKEAVARAMVEDRKNCAEADGVGARFSMRDDVGDFRCYVYRGALDSIERGVTVDMLGCFERHRATFEAVASDLHDAGLPVRITADHVVKLGGK